jgi:hypothetical protein
MSRPHRTDVRPCGALDVVRPIVVIGMHRSGTSLLVQTLSKLGLFIGRRLDVNNEPRFFQVLNEWIIQQCGGAWDNPESVKWLVAEPTARAATVDYLRVMLESPRFLSYTGFSAITYPRRSGFLSRPWGWKDPRNSITLPFWLDIFPGARVIHVRRHGVDVAASLVKRHARSLEAGLSKFKRRRFLYALKPKRGGFAESYRCATLDGAIGLWSEYTTLCERALEHMGTRAMEVRYEELLERPAELLPAIASFAGLDASARSVEELAAEFRAGRSFAYRKDGLLMTFAARAAETLRAHGYQP